MADERAPHLAVRSGGYTCALPLPAVVETLRPLPCRPLEGAPAYVAGLSVIRGEPVPVIDLSVLLAGQAGTPRRLVALRVDGRPVALQVDEVVGLVAIAPADLRATPPLVAAARPGLLESVARLDGGLLLVLEASRLLPGPDGTIPAAGGGGP